MYSQKVSFVGAVVLVLGLFSLLGGAAQAAVTTLNAGQSCVLTVSADGTAPFSYQWFRNDVALLGVTGSSHAITNVKAADAGVYHAVVKNSAGSTTSASVTLALTVAVAPSITTHPVSQTVGAGGAVNFSVKASGSPAPSYQWRKNGAAIQGATTSSYAISSAVAGDAGTYTVVATNSAGAVTSNGAILSINAAAIAPKITTQPAGRTVTAGAAVTFTVAATGTPTPSYQWHKNGTAIKGATTSSYAISSTAAGDAGTYTVVATNSAGTVTSNGAVLSISAAAVAPKITTQPAGRTVKEGAAVTFTVAATGSPAPSYQWRKNGAAISGATGATYSIANTTTKDGATYSVVATNIAGSVTSSGAVLTVNVNSAAPVFTVQPTSQAVKKGGSVTFLATATGSPSPTYQWRRNGTAIKGATNASFTLSGLTPTNAGTYTVVATNSKGSATSTGAILTVTDNAAALARVDFNADNQTDILWQNSKTGELSVWYMNGTAFDKTASLGNVAGQWKVSGVADFNGDGKADLLCQNLQTGEASIWLMSGTTVSSKVSLGVQPSKLRISGVGDYNGDNRPDIVVQDSVTREITIWLMAGTQRSTVVSLGLATADWEVVTSGDFDGDGRSDLLLQNSVTGQTNVWLVAGTKVTWKAWVATQSLEWQVSGTGDFNNDGRSDILWQNVLTGETTVFLMSGNTVKSRISLGSTPVDWVIRN